MGIAERIYEIVKQLPDGTAAEVLDYVEAKRTTGDARSVSRADALATLTKHAGKFKAVKLDRADLHDRASIR